MALLSYFTEIKIITAYHVKVFTGINDAEPSMGTQRTLPDVAFGGIPVDFAPIKVSLAGCPSLPTLQMHGAFLVRNFVYPLDKEGFHVILSGQPPRFQLSLRNAFSPFTQDQNLPLAEVLSEADVARIFAEEKVSFGKLARSFAPRGETWPRPH